MKAVRIDLSGQRFGLLLVESFAGLRHGKATWFARCDCGASGTFDGHALRSGHTSSCGCLRRTHGRTKTPEYRAWADMLDRCKNPNSRSFRNYGGRGIRVCERWQSFESFMADMGHRPTAKHSIDRIDVNGNYEPSNCRWATQLTQQRNRRSNTLVEYDGKRLSVSEWAERTGLTANALRDRLRKGMAPSEALTTPLNASKRHFASQRNALAALDGKGEA